MTHSTGKGPKSLYHHFDRLFRDSTYEIYTSNGHYEIKTPLP